MQTVIYSCPFVPAEWIAAHGLQPRRIMPRSIHPSPPVPPAFGVCPYAKAFIREVLSYQEAAGIIVTTVCDQMRRSWDYIHRHSDTPCFLLHIPTTWQRAAAADYYLRELERLGRFLVACGGQPPTKEKLAEVMLQYEEKRTAGKPSQALSSKIPLALVGGPMTQQHLDIFDRVDQAGGQIVLDATETGQRTLPAPFDRDPLQHNPLAELAKAYFGSIPDVFRRPNGGFYVWLKRELARGNVRGLILHRYVWCDIWHGERNRLKQETGLPVLSLEYDETDSHSQPRIAGRIQAFLEMLA